MSFKIAILDRGVDATYEELENCTLSGVTISSESGHFEYLTGQFEDSDQHGTTIAQLIHEVAPELPIVAVKLKGKNNRINEPLLCEGIRWCLQDSSIRVINISLGLTSRKPNLELYEACRLAHESGVIIAASCHSTLYRSCYPAFFPFVYGVACGLIRKERTQYRYLGEGEINVVTNGRVTIKNQYGKTIAKLCTSFATARFSAIAAKLLQRQAQFDWTTFHQSLVANSDSSVEPIGDSRYLKVEALAPSADVERKQEELWFQLGQKEALTPQKVALFNFPDHLWVTGRQLLPASICGRIVFSDLKENDHLLMYQERQATQSYPIAKVAKDTFQTLIVSDFHTNNSEIRMASCYHYLEQQLAASKHLVITNTKLLNFLERRQVQLKSQAKLTYLGIDQLSWDKILGHRHLPTLKTPFLLTLGIEGTHHHLLTQLWVKKLLERNGYRTFSFTTQADGVPFENDFLYSEINLPLGKLQREQDLFFEALFKWATQHRNAEIILGDIGLDLQTERTNEWPSSWQIKGTFLLKDLQPDAIILSAGMDTQSDEIKRILNWLGLQQPVPILFCHLPENKQTWNGSIQKKANAMGTTLNLPMLQDQDKLALDLIVEAFSTT